MNKNKKTAVFMSALMLCSICGSVMSKSISVFAEETGSQETQKITADDQQLISESSEKDEKKFDVYDSKMVKDLCLNKKTICENGDVAISIPVTDSFGIFSYDSELSDSKAYISKSKVCTVEDNNYYVLSLQYDEAKDDVITITNDLTKEVYTYAITGNGTKISEVSHTEAQRNIDDIEEIYSNEETKEEFCLNSRTYIKDGLCVVGTELIKSVSFFMVLNSWDEIKCLKSDTIMNGDKYYFIGIFLFDKDGKMNLNCNYSSGKDDLYYIISDNGTKIKEVTKKEYEGIPDFVPCYDEEIIDFCKNNKYMYKDGYLVIGSVSERISNVECIYNSNYSEHEYRYRTELDKYYNSNYVYSNGKYYTDSIYKIEQDGIYVFSINDSWFDFIGFEITENGNKIRELSDGQNNRLAHNFPEAVPASEEEAKEYYENHKVNYKNGIFAVVFKNEEEPEFEWCEYKDECGGYTYEGANNSGYLQLVWDDYAVRWWKNLESGIIAFKDNKETAYMIDKEESTITEIPYIQAMKTVNNFPEIVPYGEADAKDFYENKKIAYDDGTLVIVCKKGEKPDDLLFSDFDWIFGDYEVIFWKNNEFQNRTITFKDENNTTFEIMDNGKTIKEITASEDYEPGDVDGSGVTDLTDLSYLSVYLLGDYEFTPVQMLAADVTGDGEVDIRDLATLKQFICKDPDVVLKKYTK